MNHQCISKLVFVGLYRRSICRGANPQRGAQKPLTRAQILALLAGDVPSSRVAMLVQERGD